MNQKFFASQARTRRTALLGRALRVGATFALAGSLLAACGGGDTAETQAAGEVPASISMDLRNDPDTFDPTMTGGDQGAIQMFEAIYDTLVRRDMKTGEYVPAMASSWEITPTRIDFELKPGLKCSDGTDLKPSDIARSLQRLADPETGSVFTGRFFGAGGVKEIDADDEANTLFVEVNDPHSDLIDSMAGAWIVCPKGLDDIEALASTPQGSGAYRMVEMKRGDTYKLEAWGSPALEDPDSVPGEITMRVVTDDSTRANLFETGGTDIAAITGRDSQRLERESEPIKGPAFGADSIVFNLRPEAPLSDERLRRVVAQAIDAADYTKAASFDVGEPISVVNTPNMDCYTEANASIALTQDVEAAKAELAEAGYGPDGEKLKLRLLGYDIQNDGPDYVADALRSIGIEVKVTNGNLAQAAGVIYGDEGDWDLFVYPYQTSAPHPYPLVTKMSSNLGEGGSYNFGRTRNDVFDEQAALAPGETGEKRCEHWAKAEAALLEELHVVPLMWPIANYFGRGLTFDAIFRMVDLRSIRTTGN